MRSIYLVFFTAIISLVTIQANGQPPTGSLGDPVIYEGFGSGTNPGSKLDTATTNYNYTTDLCPADSSYSIVNTIGNCFANSWHNIRDASGVPNGYFMLVNANYSPGIFYVQRASATNLCANTTYQFSAMVANVMRTSACGNGGIKPRLKFTIETQSGVVLDSLITPELAPDGIWRPYPVYFTTTGSNTDVIVKITNMAPGGCGNDLALDDITFRAYGPVVPTSFGSASTTGNLDVCEGDPGTYTITANAPAGYQNYQWQHLVNNVWEDIPGEAGDKLEVPTGGLGLGDYQYRVAVVKDGNLGSLICRIFSTPNTLTVNPIPVVVPPPDQSVCFDGSLQVTASGGSRYVWEGPNLPPTEINMLTIDNAGPANDGVYYVYTISDKGCPSPPMPFRVTVSPAIVSGISSLATNNTICAGESVQLTATGGLYYQWAAAPGLSADDVANPTVTPTETTTYTVTISNDACSTQESITITVLKPPVVTTPEKLYIFEGQSVQLNGTVTGDNITAVSWSPDTDLDNASSLTPTASPTEDITYTLIAESASCGTSPSSSVFVRVYKKIIIPNTFTPNGDGINDLWNIEALFTYPESETIVHNRNGQLVFRSTGYSTPWNGTYNGSVLPAGTYYYMIDLKNNTPKLTGWVVILK